MIVLLLLVTVVSMTMPAAAQALGQVSLADPPAAPSNQVAPTIVGTAKLGATLTATTGEWTGTEPIMFGYQWMRCHPYCKRIQGATAQTYTLTEPDAYRSYDGAKTVMSVYVIATNIYGSVPKLVNPGTAVDAPLPRPGNDIQALVEATVVPDSAGTIPQILAHNGYTAWYFPFRPARVTVTWTRSGDLQGPALATGSRDFRHAGKGGTFKVRLTKRGRRLLAHAHHLTLDTDAQGGPLGGRPGGSGAGSSLELSTNAPAKLGSV